MILVLESDCHVPFTFPRFAAKTSARSTMPPLGRKKIDGQSRFRRASCGARGRTQLGAALHAPDFARFRGLKWKNPAGGK
jgi:hypothetical protein